MSIMYLMSGPSGAGKTTLARQLVDQYKVKYVGIEDFYCKRFGSELIHKDEELVWGDFEAAIRAYEQNKIDIIVDTNSPSRSDREWFVKRFPNYDIHLIIVQAEKQLCLLNNSQRTRVIPDDEMERIFASIEEVNTEEMQKYAEISLYQNLDNSGVKFVTKLK